MEIITAVESHVLNTIL